MRYGRHGGMQTMFVEEDQARKVFVVILINLPMKHEAKAPSGGAPLKS